VLDRVTLGGVAVTVRNPLPARGGLDPESIDEARLFAPAAFRARRERAITAADYGELALRDVRLQRAAAQLQWTGSWYEAEVALDPLGRAGAEPRLLAEVDGALQRYRRMGHDLHVRSARYVPLKLALEVCALPGFERGHVLAALLERFGTRTSADGARGFFHPDQLGIGQSLYLSQIIAAALGVSGVECAKVTALQRQFAAPNREIANGVLPLAANEIALLDNDPNHPEHGQLRIAVRGGR